MVIKVRARAKPHLFMPGQTVTAAIKQVNLYDVTSIEMEEILRTYKELNGDQNAKPGDSVMIPILARHQAVVLKQS